MGRISPTRQPDLAAPTPKKDGRVTRTEETLHTGGRFRVQESCGLCEAAFLGLALFLDQMVCPVLIMAPPPHSVITPVELDTLGHWLRIGEPRLFARWRLGRRSS